MPSRKSQRAPAKKPGAPIERNPGQTTGRPPALSSAKRVELCELVAEGYSTKAAMTKLGVKLNSVYNALKADPVFAKLYAQAKRDGAHADFDKIQQMADELSDQRLEQVTDNFGKPYIVAKHNSLDPQSAKVAIDALKWVAAKKLPRVYGDTDDNDKNKRTNQAPVLNLHLNSGKKAE